jgi:hypothetical protein
VLVKRLETLGARLLSLVVPTVDAAAGCGSWPSCWQCNRKYGGSCSCNAPCAGCAYSSTNYDLACVCKAC